MRHFSKILVATDSRLSDQSIIDVAAQLAERCGASLTIVDVINEHDQKDRLAVQDPASLRATTHRIAFQRLETAARLIASPGLELEIKILEGKTSTALTREVLSGSHDLLIAVAKGAHSVQPGPLGNTARLLEQQCPCQLWLPTKVTPQALEQFLTKIERQELSAPV